MSTCLQWLASTGNKTSPPFLCNPTPTYIQPRQAVLQSRPKGWHASTRGRPDLEAHLGRETVFTCRTREPVGQHLPTRSVLQCNDAHNTVTLLDFEAPPLSLSLSLSPLHALWFSASIWLITMTRHYNIANVAFQCWLFARPSLQMVHENTFAASSCAVCSCLLSWSEIWGRLIK